MFANIQENGLSATLHWNKKIGWLLISVFIFLLFSSTMIAGTSTDSFGFSDLKDSIVNELFNNQSLRVIIILLLLGIGLFGSYKMSSLVPFAFTGLIAIFFVFLPKLAEGAAAGINAGLF